MSDGPDFTNVDYSRRDTRARRPARRRLRRRYLFSRLAPGRGGATAPFTPSPDPTGVYLAGYPATY